MIKKFILFSTMALVLLAMPLMAQDKKPVSPAEQVSFEGTLVCMGCALKKSDGARSACADFGHKHALRTKDGKLISFLETKYSTDLIKGEKFHNKPIKVQGTFFANANILDIDTFEIDGKKKGWCGHCSTMDGCTFKGEMN